tara:strand:- start:862 stop:1062 length:201 start_codon:yes stop_codon:yes gene_type:complete
VPKKDKYHVKKLIFIDKKLEKTDDLYLYPEQVNSLKGELIESQYTNIQDDSINLDSFLKNINLLCK